MDTADNNNIPSIKEILAARDRRIALQKILLKKYQKTTLISFKLNIPGATKDCTVYRKVFDTGEQLLKKAIEAEHHKLQFSKSKYLFTGSEGYFCIDADPFQIKKTTAAIENNHPLGRLFDYDVLNFDGSQIKRSEIGLPVRKCFLCKEDAFICARSRKHPLPEIIKKIEEIIDNYFR